MQNEDSIIDGWARVEVMGHGVHIGKLTTHTLGTASLFRVDTPAIPAREETLKTKRYTELGYLPEGSVIRHPETEASTVLIGVPAIFRITPLTEEQATVEIIRAHRSTPVLMSSPTPLIEPPGGDDLYSGVDDQDDCEPETSEGDY